MHGTGCTIKPIIDNKSKPFHSVLMNTEDSKGNARLVYIIKEIATANMFDRAAEIAKFKLETEVEIVQWCGQDV